MGLNTLGRSCSTNYATPRGSSCPPVYVQVTTPAPVIAPAPNPDPSRWTLLRLEQCARGYVLMVRYHDCTNFEGVKVMVYRGQYSERRSLDPHFYEGDDAPIARFRPDTAGWEMALNLARTLTTL